MNTEIQLYSGSASLYLAEKIARHFGQPLGNITLTKFSDGEMLPSFEESIRGADLFLIQSTFAPSDNLMELLLMIDAAKRASANQVVVVMPYFGYARQDRKAKSRVPIGAKLVANLLTSAGADRIVTMDLHAGQIQGFFDIPLDHLDATAVFLPFLQGMNLSNLCIASPDMGGAPRARMYSRMLGAELAIIDKYRAKANVVESMRVIGDVRGRNVVLLDDMVDTAGTLVKAAEHLLEQGATSVRAAVTHPVLSGEAHNRIRNSALEQLIVTDTIPLVQDNPKITVLSIAPLFAEAFRKIHEHESISSLFIQ